MAGDCAWLIVQARPAPVCSVRRPTQFSMPKIEIEVVAEVLQENELDKAMVDRIVRQLTKAAERAADEAAAEREPQVKKQWIIIVSDPEDQIPEEDFVGWVLQIPENDSPAVAIDRLIQAAHAFNATKRGRKYPAKTLAEACEVVGGKFLKEANISVKTKLPVSVLKTDNELPPDSSGKISLDDLRSSRRTSRR